MKPYWITFGRLDRPNVLNLGAGVTARSEEDARLLASTAFAEARIVAIKPVDDVAKLDQRHVIPNMGNILVRGIWFPLGFEGKGV